MNKLCTDITLGQDFLKQYKSVEITFGGSEPTFNEEKSIFSTDTLTLFGSVISKGTIKPDPERLRPLKELPPPQNIAAQRRVIGMFSYYSKWIPSFLRK